MRQKGFAPLAILLIAFVIIIIGAGGGYYYYQTVQNTPQKLLLKASQKMSALKTVHADLIIDETAHMTDAKTGVSQSQAINLTGFADSNIPDKTTKLHMTIGTKASPNQSLAMDVLLLQQGEMYMQMSLLGPQWIHLNTKDLTDQGALPIDPQSSDFVTQSIGFLKSANPNSIIKLADEPVDGIAARHFRVDISSPQYVSFMRQISTDPTLADAFADATIVTELWIDKNNGNVIKTYTKLNNLKAIDQKTKQTTGTVDEVMTVTYSKFDQPVAIDKPQGQILEYKDLIKASQQH